MIVRSITSSSLLRRYRPTTSRILLLAEHRTKRSLNGFSRTPKSVPEPRSLDGIMNGAINVLPTCPMRSRNLWRTIFRCSYLRRSGITSITSSTFMTPRTTASCPEVPTRTRPILLGLSKPVRTTSAFSKSEMPNHRKGKSLSHCDSTHYLSGRAAVLAFAILLIASGVTPVFAQYKRTDLASNQPGVAPSTDQQHLINAWGLTAVPTGPWWLSDNGSGFSTLYNGSGQQNPLFVTVPASPSSPAGTAGSPTGIVGNISPNPTDFIVTENGKSGPARFIFATLDGTISAWNPGGDGVLPGPSTCTTLSHATIVADHVLPGAPTTGLETGTAAVGKLSFILRTVVPIAQSTFTTARLR